MAGYTYQQIEDLWVQYGGSPARAAMAASIAMAESGGNPNATNYNNDGSIDRGLFQVNSVHGSQSTFDLAANIRAAIAISNNGQNWQPWSTYNNGAYQKFYNPAVMPTGHTVQQIGGQGDTTAPDALAAAAPTLSLDTLRSQSPLVAALVTAVPELQSIFQQAVNGQWSSDKFIGAVQNSKWWATHSDSYRNAFATMKADPATWNKQVTQLQATLTSLASQLGAMPNPSQLHALALDALTNGYDQNMAELRQKFAQYVQPVSGDHFGGEAGTDETSIRQAMMQLGVFLPEGTLQQNIRNIIAGSTDVNAISGQLRSQAQATYPAYAQQIKDGMNVSDIADPYIQDAQKILEQGPGQVNILNPMIKGALQNTANGKPTPLSLTDFDVRLRQNPAWKQTANARDSIMQTAHQVLQNMGMAY